jgi:hypothetical protein
VDISVDIPFFVAIPLSARDKTTAFPISLPTMAKRPAKQQKASTVIEGNSNGRVRRRCPKFNHLVRFGMEHCRGIVVQPRRLFRSWWHRIRLGTNPSVASNAFWWIVETGSIIVELLGSSRCRDSKIRHVDCLVECRSAQQIELC